MSGHDVYHRARTTVHTRYVVARASVAMSCLTLFVTVKVAITSVRLQGAALQLANAVAQQQQTRVRGCVCESGGTHAYGVFLWVTQWAATPQTPPNMVIRHQCQSHHIAQGPGTSIPTSPKSTLDASGLSRAKLVLNNLRSISATTSNNSVYGLVNTQNFVCSARMGSGDSMFSVGTAANANLAIPCINASTLRITGTGACTQVWRPLAKQLEIIGSGNVEVMLAAQSLPSRITVKTTPRAGQGANGATLVFLYLSALRADGERLRPGALTVNAPRLVYPSYAVKTGIVLMGCGVHKVTINIPMDVNGYSAVSLFNVCWDTQAHALGYLRNLSSAVPCSFFA